MAVVRPARSSPPYALIVFIFLWVLSTGLAVLFFVWYSNASEEKDKLAGDTKAFATLAEQRVDPLRAMLDAAKKKSISGPAVGSAYAQLDARIKSLQKLISGIEGESANTDAVIGSAKSAADAAGMKDMPLLTIVRQLADTRAAAENRAKELEGQLKAAEVAYNTSTKATSDSLQTNKNVLADRDRDIARLTADLTKLRGDLDKTTGDYEAKLKKQADDFDQRIRDFVAQIGQLKGTIDRREATIADLRRKLEMVTPTVTNGPLKETDGKIIRATVGSNEVWINIGRRDHATPGLTFAVYDPKLGVGSGTESKGKGAIEISEVGENESLARIVHLEKGQTLLVNDVIANPVFNRDKNRKYRFVVAGDFDLDGDKVTTPAEREKIIRLIQSWGGIVDDQLTPQTDFVVLGEKPGSAVSKFDAATDQTDDLKKKRQDQQAAYDKLITDAKDFSIPVLNTNRFLGMIGYYNQTVVAK